MRTRDINTYKARLLGALQAYEHKALKRGGLHPQRVQDVRILRDCIHSMYDTALLDSELQLYLSKMFIRRSWSAYFWGQSAQSELKRMLEVVMADEQVQTWQLEQLMSDYQFCQHMLAGGVWEMVRMVYSANIVPCNRAMARLVKGGKKIQKRSPGTVACSHG